ncbi:unnamed protein product [Gadus morhua 'NCC']
MRMALALASSRAVTHLWRSTSVLAFRWYVRPLLLSTMLQASRACRYYCYEPLLCFCIKGEFGFFRCSPNMIFLLISAVCFCQVIFGFLIFLHLLFNQLRAVPGGRLPLLPGAQGRRLLLNMGSGGAEDRKEEEARLRVEAAGRAGGCLGAVLGSFL